MATHTRDLLQARDPVRSQLRHNRHLAATLHLVSVPSPTRSDGRPDPRRWCLRPSFQPMASDQPTRILPDRCCERLCDEPCPSCQSQYPTARLHGRSPDLPASPIPALQRHRTGQRDEPQFSDFSSQHESRSLQRRLLRLSNNKPHSKPSGELSKRNMPKQRIHRQRTDNKPRST